MDYCSKGVFAISKSNYKALSIIEGIPEFLREQCQISHDEHNLYFSYEDYKMCSGVPDIDSFNVFMDKLDEQDISYGYLRLGEEWEDVEERGEPYDFYLIPESRIAIETTTEKASSISKVLIGDLHEPENLP